MLHFVAGFTATYLSLTVTPQISEPLAPKKDHVRTLHGETFNDQYFWLREKKNPAVIEHLESENRYAKQHTTSLESLSQTIFEEFKSRIQETDLDVPVFDRGYYYYTRTEKGKQYPIHCRKKGSLQAKEEILLDVNQLAQGKKFMRVGSRSISPNGRLLAYTVDETGYRQFRLHILDLQTRKTLPDSFGFVTSVNWAADNKTLYYVIENDAKRSYRTYRKALGAKTPELIFEEKSPQFDLYAEESMDRKFLFLNSESSETTECRYVSLQDPKAKPKVMRLRTPDHQYYPDHHGNQFYIRTNYGAKEFKIARTADPTSAPSRWETVVPEQPDATLGGFLPFKDFLAVAVLRNSVNHVRIVNYDSKSHHEIKFPETNFTAFFGANPDPSSKSLRIQYTSLITPGTVFDYVPDSKKLVQKKQEKVNKYDPKGYVSEFMMIPARDGTRVPVTLCYKKGVEKNSPLWLEAYGAYGAPSFVGFSSQRVSALERGMIYAIAHVRGGGELGEKWHDDGKMSKKMNTFTDFIDVADALVEKGYTSHEKLAISGGSAGGLTMGAVMNLRPDLARCALVYVPFVDVINTMCDTSLPLTTQEFLEWGNPMVKREYEWIKRYSPYENIHAADYPSMLVRTSLNDSQVPYWEAAKYVARLRELRTNKVPLIFLCNMSAGHSGASGRYDSMKDRAMDYAFMFRELGISQ